MVQPGAQHAHKHHKVDVCAVKHDVMDDIRNQELAGTQCVIETCSKIKFKINRRNIDETFQQGLASLIKRVHKFLSKKLSFFRTYTYLENHIKLKNHIGINNCFRSLRQ